MSYVAAVSSPCQMHLLFVPNSAIASIQPSVCLSVIACLPVFCLCVRPSVCLFACGYDRPPVCLLVRMAACLPYVALSAQH